MLNLIIADTNIELLSAWSEYFKCFPEVTFENTSFSDLFLSSENIDAIIMRWIFAHERYGGEIVKNKSRIIHTNEKQKVVPFVVTIPPLDDSILDLDRDYFEFKCIFQAVIKHNKSEERHKIENLAFCIDFLYGYRDHIPYTEAKSAYKAYFEYRNKLV